MIIARAAAAENTERHTGGMGVVIKAKMVLHGGIIKVLIREKHGSSSSYDTHVSSSSYGTHVSSSYDTRGVAQWHHEGPHIIKMYVYTSLSLSLKLLNMCVCVCVCVCVYVCMCVCLCVRERESVCNI
jgi:hypothetical protein